MAKHARSLERATEGYYLEHELTTIHRSSRLSSSANARRVAYPAWDALANFVDAQCTGGLSRNKTLLLNFIISIITTAAVAIALGKGMYAVLAVFGVRAALSGVFRLATDIRRWASGAQWAMVLSGAQSALAGIGFVRMAGSGATIDIINIAP